MFCPGPCHPGAGLQTLELARLASHALPPGGVGFSSLGAVGFVLCEGFLRLLKVSSCYDPRLLKIQLRGVERAVTLGVDSFFGFNHRSLQTPDPLSLVSGGFLERRIPGKNGEGTSRNVVYLTS